MRLTDFLRSRQHGLSKHIVVKNKTILFQDINAVIELHDWDFCDITKFHEFKSKYLFPKNEELSKKDREEIPQNISAPQILIQREPSISNSGPLIALYLYEKSQLTGDSLLHIRSVNKFEQMWARYFLNFVSAQINNPKVFRRGFYEYCQSGDMEFTYRTSDNSKHNSGRLRILSFAFSDHVLFMYAFDNYDDELKQDDLDAFAASIKRISETS